MTKTSIQYITKCLCKFYKVKPPRIAFSRSRGTYAGLYSPTHQSIWLDEKFSSAPVLIHELAHHVTECYGYIHNPHGARWLGIYLWMLDSAHCLPLAASIPSIKAAGLKFRDPIKECSPKTLKRYLE